MKHMPELVKQWAQRLVRMALLVVLFFAALSGTVRWQQRMDAQGCGRCDEVCASFVLAERCAQGAGFSITSGEHVLLLEDSYWRVLLGGLTRFTHQPAVSAYILGALCGFITLWLGMRLTTRFGYHPVARWFFAFALLFSPGWLSSLVEGHSTPLAAALVLWAVWSHVEWMERRTTPLALPLAVILAFAVYVRLEFAWLWIVFVLHYLLNSWRAREPLTETSFLLLRGVAGALLLLFLLLPLAAWHWPVLGWPPLRIPAAPLATDQQPVWQLILAAIPKAYIRWEHSPYWSAWALLALALVGTAGLALRAWRYPESRSAFVIPLILVLMPLFYALTYPVTGWPSSEVVFAAFDPLAVLACAVAASRVPDWIARLLRRRFFLHAAWLSALRVAVGLLLGIAVLLESIRWNVTWSAESHARMQTRHALKELLATAARDAQPPLVLTDEPGWILWRTPASVADLSGRLMPDYIRHYAGHDSLELYKLKKKIKAYPTAYAIMWNSTYTHLLEELGFKALPLPGASTDPRWSPPRVYKLKHSPGAP
ncbi:MAG: hypothetical protein EPN23_04960 [Verrucomicrobia bacterium]|nr:MAG: hypothetical protein EPN23_04960 [Verrucomicrobiota bacterium]